MRKGWIQKKIKENAWGLIFERWYLIAPSGNKYHFWRNCYFNTIYVPTTYDALSVKDKDAWSKTNDPNRTLIKAFNRSGKTKLVPFKQFDGTIINVKDVVRDEYQQVLQFIYDIEAKGGFPEQNKMNQWLDNNKEMRYLFSQSDRTIKYNSMP